MFELALVAGTVALGYIIGSSREKRHFASLIQRENGLLAIPIRMDQGPERASGDVFMVAANVVVATDAFKKLAGQLRNVIGGRMRSHESLVDRARREALVRLKEVAKAHGCTEIINARIQTSMISGQAVEVVAYGTAHRP
jgi:uncharacterized protein YbjQ (UPF0145 family)